MSRLSPWRCWGLWPACPTKESRLWPSQEGTVGEGDEPVCGLLLPGGAGGRKEPDPRASNRRSSCRPETCSHWTLTSLPSSPPTWSWAETFFYRRKKRCPFLCDWHWLLGNSPCLSLNSASKGVFLSPSKAWLYLRAVLWPSCLTTVALLSSSPKWGDCAIRGLTFFMFKVGEPFL